MRRGPIAVGLLCAVHFGCQPAERVNGGGSSFVYPLMLKWTRVYAQETGTQIDYQSSGSGNGILQMTMQTIDFGCTDAPMTAEQRKKAEAINGAVIHIPLAMGGVVPVYNLPGLPEGKRLRFSGPVLADIFLGNITRWDDPALAALNPGVPLPARDILVISRSDPSGTTAVLADFLYKVRKDGWEAKNLGKPGTATRFPAGEAQRGNEGIAGLVRRVPGSFGYVELKYALDIGLEYGAVKNRSGQFVAASPESIRAAADSLAAIPEDLCFSLTDPPGANAYPISGTVWAVFYRGQSSARRETLSRFLRWATDPAGGQPYATELGYAPLPQALGTRVRESLAAVTNY